MRRMTYRRKAEIAANIEAGKTTLEKVAAELNASEEEIRGWIFRLKKFGGQALRATRIQDVRAMEAEAA